MKSRDADGPGPGWARARAVLERLAQSQSPPHSKIEVGRVMKIGDGLSRDAFAAELTVDPDLDALSDVYAVLLPRNGALPDLNVRTHQELRLLAWLSGQALRFRVPRPLGVMPDRHGIALARSFIRGVPLDLRAGRQPSLRPWQVVGEIAAAIHGLDLSSAPALFVDHGTRRDHALASLAILGQLEEPEAKDAHAWAMEHLPPALPSSLVHGDLLGQNILIDPGEERPFAVIDWEYAMRGDPAYDLAIVTRGKRTPFQQPDGFRALLESYAACGHALAADHVRVHELGMAGHRYFEALKEGPGEGRPPEESLALIRRVLKMASAAG
jgi:aminoglycoside phosphotransferase (APT) family kinase protein